MEVDEAELDRLAKVLHWKMEHLDPTADDDWEKMTERQREFYRLCVKAVLLELRKG